MIKKIIFTLVLFISYKLFAQDTVSFDIYKTDLYRVDNYPYFLILINKNKSIENIENVLNYLANYLHSYLFSAIFYDDIRGVDAAIKANDNQTLCDTDRCWFYNRRLAEYNGGLYDNPYELIIGDNKQILMFNPIQ